MRFVLIFDGWYSTPLDQAYCPDEQSRRERCEAVGNWLHEPLGLYLARIGFRAQARGVIARTRAGRDSGCPRVLCGFSIVTDSFSVGFDVDVNGLNGKEDEEGRRS